MSKTDPTAINFGCGQNKLSGFINVDVNPDVNPDKVVDMKKFPYDFATDSVDRIVCYHTIEHIESHFHFNVLNELWRILKPGGILILSYPEFLICAENYKTNYQGRRDFWAATIFGRQSRPDDYHVSLMDSTFFCPLLEDIGFINVTKLPEKSQPFNTIVTALKGEKRPSYEQALAKEFFS